MSQSSDRVGPSGLLILMPAYNEAAGIGAVVTETLSYGCPILVLDDGSADATPSTARESGAEVLRLEENQGKGAALERGFAYAREKGFDAVVTMDADGQHAPSDLPHFFDAYQAGSADVLIGNRFGDASTMPWIRRMTNRLMSGLLSHAMGQHVPDTQNGYRLYRLEALRDISLRAHRFEAESEILLHLAQRGIAIGAVPVATIYGSEESKIRPVRDSLRFFRMLRRFWQAKLRAKLEKA